MMSYDYPHPVSRTYQYKKITKPLLERKRRARINRCLDELKDLMVDALETEGENISKLEKADILELTVRHLQRLHASRPSGLSLSASPNDDAPSKESRWQSGFGHCAAEACKYLAALPGESGERLARHLASGLQSNRQQNNSPLSPKVEGPFSAVSMEKTTNLGESRSPRLPMETTVTMTNSQQAKSSIPSLRYSIASETSDNQEGSNTASIALHTFENCQRDGSTPNSNPCLAVPKNADNGRAMDVTITENIILKTDNRLVGNDDDEEIDVEGVDESDPMWRPW